MTKRKELNVILNKIINNRIKCDKIYNENFELRHVQNNLVVKVIMEEKLFKKTKWLVDYDERSENKFYINYAGEREDPEMKRISDLLDADYHAHYEVYPNIHLRFDDHEVCLRFKEVNELIKFIKESELQIDFNDLNKEINASKLKIETLESFKKNFE